jgi:ABC-type multidrug transport system ATPase subunit
MLRSLKQQGITILVSTPYMDEASLCDRVALIQNGEILSVDSPQGVIASYRHPLLAIKDDNMLQLLTLLQQYDGVLDAYPFGEYHHVVLKDGITESSVNAYLQQHQFGHVEVKSIRADIEDCFIALMKTESQ